MSAQPQPSWRDEIRTVFDGHYPDILTRGTDEPRREMANRMSWSQFSDEAENELRQLGLYELVKSWTRGSSGTGLAKNADTGMRVVKSFQQLTLDDLLHDITLRREQLIGDQYELAVREEIAAAMTAKGATSTTEIGSVLSGDELADIRISVAERFRAA